MKRERTLNVKEFREEAKIIKILIIKGDVCGDLAIKEDVT
jgi:hypothetical protein